MEERIIRITLRKHDTSPLLAATSDDLQGLIVFGRTWQEIEKKLPNAVRALLEAMGFNGDQLARQLGSLRPER
jgi:hypothetical protein